MDYSIHTDLAIESAILSSPKAVENCKGIQTDYYCKNSVSVTKVKVTDHEGEKLVGKPCGEYITLEVPQLRNDSKEAVEDTVAVLTEELCNILNLHPHQCVLVIGLGNRFVTPDALGPKAVDKLLVTRHLGEILPKDITDNMSPLCAVAPGVLGVTGIETGEVAKGITDVIHPDIIIAIDALASRSTQRIGTTVQLANTGIIPGAGIGNNRKELSQKTLGVPVIALGVPTVIEGIAVANDAIDLMIETIRKYGDSDSPLYRSITAFDNEKRYSLIESLLSPEAKDLIVTPKEIDSMIDKVSSLIAEAINDAVSGDTAKFLGTIL